MAFDIFYTDKAKDTLNVVYAFITHNFSLAIADKFIAQTEVKIKLISENPFIYKSSILDEQIRIALINTHSSLFYQIRRDRIYLLFFWDNRQEPFFTTD